MNRQSLIDAILIERERIWSETDFSGEWGEYEWLESNYGVTTDDEANWTGILNHEYGVNDPEDDPEFLAFITDDVRVVPFLQDLLRKYRSNSAVAPRDIPIVRRRSDPATG